MTGRLVPVETPLPKPLPGDPCNGCGACCMATKCGLAIGLFGPEPEGPCPALEWEGARYVCGLVASPMAYAKGKAREYGEDALSAAARAGIGMGTGCDARTVDEPDYPPGWLEGHSAWAEQNTVRVVAAFNTWLGWARAREVLIPLLEKALGRQP